MIYDLQRASMWKRISALLFDIIIFSIITVGAATLISGAVGYSAHYEGFEVLRDSYEDRYLEEAGMPTNLKDSEYALLTDEEKKIYDDAIENAYTALLKDEDAKYHYSMLINLSIIIASFSILSAFLLLEFIVPIIFKNGQTVGKKIFGVGIMNVNGVKISTLSLFIRTVLGKFTVETMIPVITVIMFVFGTASIFNLLIVFLLLTAQLLSLIISKNNSAIHDLLSQTVAVDLASQMIFDSVEARDSYKRKIHEEQSKDTRGY